MDNNQLDEQDQKSNWKMMESYLNALLQELDESNLERSFKSLFEVNVVLAQNIIVQLLLKYQRMKNRPIVYAALAARLNSQLPEAGATLTKETTALFIEAYNKMDNKTAYIMVSFLSQLFNFEVVHEIVILQVLHLLLENLDNASMEIVIQLLRQSGKHLLEVSNTAHDMIFEKLREILQSGKLDLATHKSLELLFDWRRLNYEPSQSKTLTMPKEQTNTHTFMIDSENLKPSRNLGDFKYDPDFMETENAYQALKEHVELSLNEQNANKEQIPVLAKDLTGNRDIEFKKKVYLILKSSLSSDEAAHKILKLRIPDKDKYKVVDIIIKSSVQESTYSKFYGLLSERLCSSHASWKPAFERTFRENYEKTDELEPAQLRILGKLWGHILASDYIGFEIFECVHMNEDETTPPGRIFLKFVMQELVAELGIDILKARFEEEYIQPYLRNLFPIDDASRMRYSINYFTAIGLGILTEKMRNHLIITHEHESNQGVEQENSENIQQDKERVSSKHTILHYEQGNRAHSRIGRNRSTTSTKGYRRTSVTPPRRTNRSRSPKGR